MAEPEPEPDRDLPPLKLREHRRVVPELALPSIRRDRAAYTPPRIQPLEREGLDSQADPAEAPRAERPMPVSRSARPPLYWRVLRLRHVHPNGWQRAVLAEGAVAAAVVIVLAGVATAWTVLVLPVVVALVVKGHDVLAGGLEPARRRRT